MLTKRAVIFKTVDFHVCRAPKPVPLTSLNKTIVSYCSQIRTGWQTVFFFSFAQQRHLPDTRSSAHSFYQCCSFRIMHFLLLFPGTYLFLFFFPHSFTGLKHSMNKLISSTNNVHSCLFLKSRFYFFF